MVEILNYELPSGQLEYWPVFQSAQQKERPDNKTKIDPYDWANLPVLEVDNTGSSKDNTFLGIILFENRSWNETY